MKLNRVSSGGPNTASLQNFLLPSYLLQPEFLAPAIFLHIQIFPTIIFTGTHYLQSFYMVKKKMIGISKGASFSLGLSLYAAFVHEIKTQHWKSYSQSCQSRGNRARWGKRMPWNQSTWFRSPFHSLLSVWTLTGLTPWACVLNYKMRVKVTPDRLVVRLKTSSASDFCYQYTTNIALKLLQEKILKCRAMVSPLETLNLIV